MLDGNAFPFYRVAWIPPSFLPCWRSILLQVQTVLFGCLLPSRVAVAATTVAGAMEATGQPRKLTVLAESTMLMTLRGRNGRCKILCACFAVVVSVRLLAAAAAAAAVIGNGGVLLLRRLDNTLAALHSQMDRQAAWQEGKQAGRPTDPANRRAGKQASNNCIRPSVRRPSRQQT